MRIQHNIAALNSYRQLAGNNNAVSKNLEKLSSGYKINRAGDDAAGLAISEKMRAQITGLETAQKNANDGISLVQTAEGALTEVHSMLNRMTELATQSANGTYDNEVDRANLQKEVETLKSEIDRISQSTNFNGIKLLDGSMGDATGVELTKGAASAGTALGSAMSAPLSSVENGELTKGSDAVAASSSFYMPDEIVVSYDADANKAGTVTLDFSVDDGEGGTNDITVTLTGQNQAGDVSKFSMDDVVSVLNGGTVAGIAVSVSGGGAANSAALVSDAYDFSFADNKFVVTAKEAGQGYGVSTPLAVAGTGGAAGDGAEDIAAMTKILKEDYAGAKNPGAADAITLGEESRQAIIGEDAVDGSYKVASAVATLDAAANMHGKAITVGGKTYIMKDKSTDLDPDIDTSGMTVVEFDKTAAGDGTTNKHAAYALAQAINKNAADTGIQAKVDSATQITFSETEAYGNKVYAGDKESIDMSKAITASDYKIGATSGNQQVEISGDLVAGTQVTVNGKTYEFVSDPANVTAGKIAVQFTDGDAAANATALLNKIKAEDTSMASAAILNGSTLDLASDSVKVSTNSKGLTLQVGDTAANYQKVSVVVKSMSTDSLGIADINVGTQEGAAAAIDKIKNAINSVSSTRGDLGAIQNRLEHTINNLGVTTENMTAAESRIRDTDMAEEMMAYTKNNILVQSAQAMLAQANQLPQGVLQLLQ